MRLVPFCCSRIGSSPRLRGTRSPLPPPQRDGRFIPAPAGNTPDRLARRSARPVHPRACGEHLGIHVKQHWVNGSSPRLRGTQRHAAGHRREPRFIPAPAGNTRIRDAGQVRIGGSSPRLRGTPARRQRTLDRGRFIPAPAGNTAASCSCASASAVHPRACGEHLQHDRHPYRPRGSSPRLRGTQPAPRSAQMEPRFIPAPAGNTRSPSGTSSIGPVHPRACGEHDLHACMHRRMDGSSPRLRGTLAALLPGGGMNRFIPAPAGNTRYRQLPAGSRAVHPRACGEHLQG